MSSLSWSDRHLVLPIWASLYLTLAWTTWIQGQEQRSGSQSFDAGAAVIETHCVSCHSGASPEGSLDLSTRSGLLKGSESGMVLD
ncbi:MAG: c-type cytochrome domain-containing protein, partial [Pirellulaceae bacterium]